LPDVAAGQFRDGHLRNAGQQADRAANRATSAKFSGTLTAIDLQDKNIESQIHVRHKDVQGG